MNSVRRVDFQPYDPEFAADPYPTYRRLREESPIFYSPDFGLTFFTRYTDIVKLLADRRVGRSMDPVLTPEDLADRQRGADGDRLPTYDRFVRSNLLETEGRQHARLRRLLSTTFSPKRIGSLRGRIQELVDGLLQHTIPRGQMEFMEELAVPLPVYVISELLGWPVEERDRLRPWSAAIVKLYEKDHTGSDEAQAETATAEFAEMLTQLVNKRRKAPADDLISALVQVESEGERLSPDELIATCMLLLNAGHEATVNAAGNSLLALLRHPDQLEQLKANPSLLPTAIEEMLRYDSPLHFFHRYVLEGFEYKGFEFSKGDTIGYLYGSANRDPEAFEDADRLDIARDPNRHVAFGRGVHFCIGAPLARLELEVLFSTLLRRIPGIQLADQEPEYNTGLVFRGLKRLQLGW
jgi:cytochrome P450